MNHYMLRVDTFSGGEDKIPFAAENDKQAVLDGLDAALLMDGVFGNVLSIQIDTMNVGPVLNQIIQTDYSRRLFDTRNQEHNIIEYDDLPLKFKAFVREFILA